MRYDLSFADKFEREQERGLVRESSVERVNRGVMQAVEDISHYEEEMQAMASLAPEAEDLNDRFLEQEGFTRRDIEDGMAPAYVSERMMDESMSADDYQKEASNAWLELYDAAYRVDSALDSESREMLGAGYEKYCLDRKQTEADAYRKARQEQRDAASQPGTRNVRFSKETGESYLEIGEKDDGFSFDEFD